MQSLSRTILNLVLALLSSLALGERAEAAECPSSCPGTTSSVIEALSEARSFTDRAGTSGKSNRCSYNSPKCTIATARFIGPEQVYKVVLHKDNYVRFALSFPKDKCRLIMVLTASDKNCTCERHSQGDLDGNLETFEGHFAEGTYYLYVDSIDPTSCPQYTLTAAGFNPTPDLVLDLVAPSSVYAGGELKYGLALRNAGNLDATAVKVTQPILPGTQFKSSNGCGQEGNTVVCKFDRLGVSESAPGRTLTFAIDPATRGKLVASARAEATEGDPTSPNVDSATINVNTKVNLSVQHNFPVTFNAGTAISYSLTVSNTEISDATKVVLTNKLPPGLTFTKVPVGCSNLGSTSVCDKISRIKALSSDTILPFTVKSTSSVFGKMSHDVSVKADEIKPGPVSTAINTEARRLANMTITMDKPTPAIQAAGEKLTYRITVVNTGPSDSAKVVVTDNLPSGLTFLGSSSNCSATEDKASVTCEILKLPVGPQGKTVTFDARIDSSLDETTLVNRATVQAKDNSTDPVVTSKSVEARVFVQADMLAQALKVERLPWTLPPTPGGVKAGENLLYTVSAVNSGPSDFRGGDLQDELPPGLDFVSSPDGCSVTDRTVRCSMPALKKDGNLVRRFVVGVAPSRSGLLDNPVCVSSRFKAHDPQEKNNCANTATRVETEADLSVTLSDSPDAVGPGDELTYKVNVRNEGPSNASGVVVDLEATPIELDDVAAGTVKSRAHKVLAPDERGIVKAEAQVTSDTVNLNKDNDVAETSTTVAKPEDIDLAVGLSADAEAAVAGRPLTYKVTLTNQGLTASGETDISVSFSKEVSVSPADCCRFDALAPGASQTRALTVDVGSDATGSLRATADIVQADTLNPDNNSSSTEIPVVQTTKAELCANWSVRFLRSQASGISTDLLFFVPSLPEGAVATGRVFTEAGDFLQAVSVTSDREDFRRPTLSLLANAGSIEWTLQKGRVGSVSSIHKRDGAEIQIPGFCRRPGHPGAKALLLPSFQVDAAANTFVAIRNETDETVNVRITYSDESKATREQTQTIAVHGVWSLSLRAALKLFDVKSFSGSLEIEAFRVSDDKPVEALSGDFLRIGPDGLSGSALERKPD